MCHWKHLGGVKNPVDIGKRAFNIEELKGRERITGPACVKRQESEWPQKVIFIFASDKKIYHH